MLAAARTMISSHLRRMLSQVAAHNPIRVTGNQHRPTKTAECSTHSAVFVPYFGIFNSQAAKHTIAKCKTIDPLWLPHPNPLPRGEREPESPLPAWERGRGEGI